MLHRHEPVTEEEMEWESPRYSVCETIRQAYHLITKTDDGLIHYDNDLVEAKLKLREATAMAKAMSEKLAQKKPNWFWNFWDKNPEAVSKRPELRRPIDVLLIAFDDYANTGYRFWLCAKELGLNSLMVKGIRHNFDYPDQAPLHPSCRHQPHSREPFLYMTPGLESLIESSNVIHLLASHFPYCAAKWDQHPVIIQHGGTAYRQATEKHNEFFNKFVDKTIIQCPDLLGHGAKDEVLIYYPVDTNFIRPDFAKKDPSKLVVGHFPSNIIADVKGTNTIMMAVDELLNAGYPIKWLGPDGIKQWQVWPWEKQLERIKTCDVIVETCAPKQGDKSYGEWGNAALEAAASGCVIVTNCVHQDIYEREYGHLGIHVANDPETLKKELVRLTKLSDDELLGEKKACCEWAETNHSIPATAERLWNRVYSRYF